MTTRDNQDWQEQLEKRITRRQMLKAAGLSGLGLVLAACQSPAPTTTSTTTKTEQQKAAAPAAPAAPQPAAKGGGTLRIGYDADIAKLDPGVAQSGVDWIPGNMIFGRLVNFDNTMAAPIPDIAESWQLASDNLTWTFKIRQGVLFHTGRECTAEDVEYSFKRGFELGPKGRFAGYMASVDTYKATGKYEFQIKLKQPDYSFFPNLATGSNAVYDKDTIATIETKPIGTGPYEFVEWIPGEKVRYKKFAKYWDQKLIGGWPDEIVTMPIKEEQTRIASLKSGQIDIAVNISPQFRKEIAGTAGLQLLEQEYTSSYLCVDFNHRKAPFDNVKLRQAMLRAVDRETINKNVFFGTGRTGCNLIPQGHWAYTDIGCPSFDLAAAKKMIDDAGIKGPLKVKARVSNAQAHEVKIAEILQKDWKQLGIDLEIEVLEPAVWLEDVWTKKNADVIVAWYTREPDPDGLFSSVLRKDQGNNWMGYTHAQVEEWFNEGKRVSEKDKRKVSYEQIMKKALLEDAALVKIQTMEVAWAANTKVKNFKILPRGYPNLYQWEWVGG